VKVARFRTTTQSNINLTQQIEKPMTPSFNQKQEIKPIHRKQLLFESPFILLEIH